MGLSKDQLLSHLMELGIDFVSYEHPVVMTVDAQAKYVGHIGGLSKNLFLKDKKQRFYVVSALAGTNVDLKVLSQRLGLGKGGIRMAPEESLLEILQVPLGCVTPFALINESARSVSLILDKGFKAQEFCFFHPLANDMTISLAAGDLDKFLVSIGKKPSYVDLEANPIVGKDQPPDLADLVPSVVAAAPNPVERTVEVSSTNNVPAKKSTEVKEKVSTKPIRDKTAAINRNNSSDNPLASITDVKSFVDKIIQMASLAVPAENKEEVGVAEHVRRDLENLVITFKNAAYSQGFISGRNTSPNRRPPGTLKFQGQGT